MKQRIVFLIAVFFGLVSSGGGSAAQSPQGIHLIESVRVSASPPAISLLFSKPTQFKVLPAEEKERAVAFKNVSIPKGLATSAPDSGWIEKLRFDRLPDQVLRLVFRTRQPIAGIDAGWGGDGRLFVIRATLESTATSPERPRASSVPEKHPRASLMKKRAEGIARSPEKPVAKTASPMVREIEPSEPLPRKRPGKRAENAGSGTIDDIFLVLAADPCWKETVIQKTAEYCKKKLYDDAYLMINSYLEANVPIHCRAAAFYLRGYVVYKRSQNADEFQLLETATLLQDAVSYFPQTTYSPFGIAMLGKIYLALKNSAEAKGYFKIVLESFQDYIGLPEILYEMGRLAANDKKYRQAQSFYESILNQYPESLYVKDARLEMGKTLFETNQYVRALQFLNGLRTDYPRMIYQNPDLLRYLGNSYYHIENYPKAREYLAAAYNLFPDATEGHIVLTRIGDTYADQGLSEKAKKIYNQVQDAYPGTDGYVISAMRAAKYETSKEGREAIYQNIIDEFPDHPMASLSRLRLAEIQQAEGEYKKSIDTINALLRERTRALRREAVYLKEKSFELWFEEMESENNYPKMLEVYESEYPAIRRFQNPGLYYMGGKAYFNGHLYAQAADSLDKAMGIYRKNRIPNDLYYYLGAAQQAEGKNDAAVDNLKQYLQSAPKGAYRVEAHKFISQSYLSRNEYDNASKHLSAALRRSRDDREKYEIYLLQAQVAGARGKIKEKIGLLAKAVSLMTAASEIPWQKAAFAHRELGDARMAVKAYMQAAEDYQLAIRYFQEADQSKSGLTDLRYALAEAYEKAEALEQATAVYREIVATGDPFWGRLAQEKLRGINLEMRLGRTG